MAGPVVSAVYGAWRLAHFDARGLEHIDRSSEGAVRSFLAALFLAPPYLALLLLRQPDWVDPARYYILHAIGYVVSWTLFPLAMVGVARLIGREDRYVGFVAAYNWSAIVQNGVHFAVAFLAEAEILAPRAITFLGLVATAAVAAYAWFVARVALAAPPGAAAAVVFLDIVLGVFIERLAVKLI